MGGRGGQSTQDSSQRQENDQFGNLGGGLEDSAQLISGSGDILFTDSLTPETVELFTQTTDIVGNSLDIQESIVRESLETVEQANENSLKLQQDALESQSDLAQAALGSQSSLAQNAIDSINDLVIKTSNSSNQAFTTALNAVQTRFERAEATQDERFADGILKPVLLAGVAGVALLTVLRK